MPSFPGWLRRHQKIKMTVILSENSPVGAAGLVNIRWSWTAIGQPKTIEGRHG
jgi:hypothetical protein